MRSAPGERQGRTCDEIGDDPRHQDFVGLRLGHDARSRMHSDAADIPTPDFDFACVKTRANGQADLPCGRSERESASDAAGRPVESGQNAVTGGLDQIPTMLLDHLQRQLIVTIEQFAPGAVAHRGGAARRVDDIREQHRGKNALEVA